MNCTTLGITQMFPNNLFTFGISNCEQSSSLTDSNERIRLCPHRNFSVRAHIRGDNPDGVPIKVCFDQHWNLHYADIVEHRRHAEYVRVLRLSHPSTDDKNIRELGDNHTLSISLVWAAIVSHVHGDSPPILNMDGTANIFYVPDINDSIGLICVRRIPYSKLWSLRSEDVGHRVWEPNSHVISL
jgi:hypothetical protein